MIIKSIELCNFRNYEREEFHFHEGTNVLYGDNAQGKTNVLEAIFVGGTTKSHKGSKDSDMIMKGREEAHLRYFVEKNECTYKVEIHMRKGRTKGIAIDGLPIGSSKELMGLCNIIFFSPEDLGIIKDGPEQRRRFMDMELCQINKAYLYYLTQYKKILKQRNALLKQIKQKPDLKETLEIWDNQLVENGSKLIEIREQFVEEVADIMKEKHRNLTGGQEDIEVKYKPNCTAKDFSRQLFMEGDRDVLLGTTTVGPHRDDIQFFINGQEVKVYGSQGQKRTAALSLKMAEIEIVEKIIGEKPILLLDDVLSELDRSRQNYLLENIKGIQTIITCTGLEEFVTNGININQTFEIVNGKINDH
ncbi:MAG: DNA replication/repair protein RecF [Eubacterium sp.]|nr:DNA replication/repair protein RecF [Eubacterium sp.]